MKHQVNISYMKICLEFDITYYCGFDWIIFFTEDEKSADDFSSFDSDLDPMFLPSSEEDFSMSSDASIEENKIDFAKKKVFKKKNQK